LIEEPDSFIKIRQDIRRVSTYLQDLQSDEDELRRYLVYSQRLKSLLLVDRPLDSVYPFPPKVLDDLQWLSSFSLDDMLERLGDHLPQSISNSKLARLICLNVAAQLHPDFVSVFLDVLNRKLGSEAGLSFLSTPKFKSLFNRGLQDFIEEKIGKAPSATLKTASFDPANLGDGKAQEILMSIETARAESNSKLGQLRNDLQLVERSWLDENGLGHFKSLLDATAWVQKQLSNVDIASWTYKGKWIKAVAYLVGLDQSNKCATCLGLTKDALRLVKHGLPEHFGISQEIFISEIKSGFEEDPLLFLVSESNRLELIKQLVSEHGFGGVVRDLYLHVYTRGPGAALSRHDIDRLKATISQERFVVGLEKLGLRGDDWANFLKENTSELCRYNLTLEHFEEFISNRQKSVEFEAIRASLSGV
jgi:hypothetical protein